MATTMEDNKLVVNQDIDPNPSSPSPSTESLDESGYCTFAVTGARPYFQAIYVCQACCSSSPAAAEDVGDNGNGNRDGDGDGDDGFEQQPQHLCICQACAHTCHRHEESFIDVDGNESDIEAPMVQYIGMGPSYCDCPFNKKHPCRIAHVSRHEAQRLQIQPGQLHRIRNEMNNTHEVESVETMTERKQSCTHFVRDVFCIPTLQDDEALVRLLRRQAETLVNQHSKETFWIDYHQNHNDDDDDDSHMPGSGGYCALESLAWAVARNHIQHYASQKELVDVTQCSGMEWWVQVKHVHQHHHQHQHDLDNGDTSHAASATRTDNGASNGTVDLLQGCTGQQELEQGIELHYDKDEAVAESFGLGVFPVLSTVTYLCEPTSTATPMGGAPRVPPTLIFSHCYDTTLNGSADNDDLGSFNMTNIPDMLVSHAAPGKQVVFDGRLLHGAPAHKALRPLLSMPMMNARGDVVVDGRECWTQNSASTTTTTAKNANDHSPPSTRITFLVNLWTDQYKPAGVQVLPDDVRQSLLELEQEQRCVPLRLWDKDKPWQCEEIASKELRDETADLPLELCGRIELPFVGNNTLATLRQEDEVDEEEEHIVVVTFPPPPSMHSTLRVHFGPGLQAYLDNSSATNTSSDQHQQPDTSTLQLPASLARFCEQRAEENGFTSTTGASASETVFI